MNKSKGDFMKTTVTFTLSVLLSVWFVGAETVSLKGSVKKTGGTAGIAGVKVSLVKLSGLSATTAADGAFLLTGTTASKRSSNEANAPIQFMIKGNRVMVGPVSNNIPGSVDVFTSMGKMKTSVKLHDMPMSGWQTVTLPPLGSGISFMRVVIGAESFTRALVCVGNDLRENAARTTAANKGAFMLAKQLSSPAVDTLKAERDGYFMKKVAIEKYASENVAITLDTNDGGSAGACTREALQAIADRYIAAQKAGDPSQIPLASEVKYLQNNKTTTAEKCIWKTAMPIDRSQNFFDVDSCRIFTEIISASGSTQWVIMMWLKVENGKISTVDAMVTTKGDFQFNATKYLNYTKDQDWSVLTAQHQISRQKLINGANAYLDMFSGVSVDTVPWGTPCARVEGGNMYVTPDCIQGMPGHGGTGTANITNRRYAVDVDMGTVDVFCSFAGSMPDSHMFRLIDGKIRLVHTLSVQNK
jgi:hypothetical protein